MPIYCTTAACARKKKQATYGVQGSRKMQWCGTCAKEHGGVYAAKWPMCEDCHDKWANFGPPNTKERILALAASHSDYSKN